MTSITVATADLRQALIAVAPHVSDDEGLPALCRVHLDPGPDNLTVTATQRYTAAIAIASIEEHHEEEVAAFDLSTQDVKEILALFRGPTKDESPDATLRLDVTAEHTIVTDTAGMFEGKSLSLPRQPDAGFPNADAGLPNVAALIDRVIRRVTDEPASALTTNGRLLGLFGSAAKAYGQPLILEPGEGNQPLLISCGESFLGLLMPIIGSTEAEAEAQEWRAAWLRRLESREPVPA